MSVTIGKCSICNVPWDENHKTTDKCLITMYLELIEQDMDKVTGYVKSLKEVLNK